MKTLQIVRPAVLALAAIVSWALPTPAVAQTASAGFEITPWAGYRVGGEFSDADGSTEITLEDSNAWGLTVNGFVRPDAEWEVLYASQSTSVEASGAVSQSGNLNVDVQYLQVGGTLLFEGERSRPFIALTIGASRFDPTPGDYSAKTFLSGSFGGGWKIGLGDNFALRLEGRVYTTFVDDNNSLFCQSTGGNGSCLIVLDGKLFNQWEARAGLTIRF